MQFKSPYQNDSRVLNKPKLEEIQFFKNIANFNLNFGIKYLITGDYLDKWKQFKNLEIIEFANVSKI